MKIQRSDIRRFLQVAYKFWESTIEGEPQVVVVTLRHWSLGQS